MLAIKYLHFIFTTFLTRRTPVSDFIGRTLLVNPWIVR